MKKLALTLLLTVTCTIPSVLFGAACNSLSGNCLSIQQVGNTSFSDVSQFGNNNLATTFQKSQQTQPLPFWNRALATTIYQDGDKNEAHVTQYSGSGKSDKDAQRAGITQVGDRNKTTITQGEDKGLQGGMALVWQYGNDNSANITHSARGTFGSIYQEGNSNEGVINTRSAENTETDWVTITQVGANNRSNITSTQGNWTHGMVSQTGSSNVANQVIDGPNNQVQITQLGNNNRSTQSVRSKALTTYAATGSFVKQSGNNNQSDVVNHDGNHSVDRVEQYGDNNRASLNISRNDYAQVKVGQSGNGNAAEVLIGGSGNNVDVAQNGDSNFAGINISGSGNRALVSQAGNGNKAYQTINGSGNNLSIYQQGSSNYASQKIIGDNNVLSISQVGNNNNGLIDWKGNNSNLSISQNGNGLSYSIVGQGDGRQMAITQSN